MKLIYTGVLLFVALNSFGQRNIRFAQLNFVQGVNNPAALALDAKLMVDIIARNQWFGVEGAPTTMAVNGNYELDDDMAVGLNVFHDRIGVNQTTSISGQYAYRMFTQSGNMFSLGLGLGIENIINDYASTQTTTPNDPAFASSFSRVMFNGSFGVYYYAPRFYIGASIPTIFNTNYSVGKTSLRPNPHYYLSTGFYLSNARGSYTFQPNIQVKAALNTPLAADLVLRNTFSGRFSLIVGYRTENSIIAGFDVLISPMVRAGYSFNYDILALSRAKGMSNELYIGLGFPYRSDRSDFGRRRYIGNKGGFKRTYKRKHNNKNKTRFNR